MSDLNDDTAAENDIVERVRISGRLLLSELGLVGGDKERTLRLIKSAARKDRLVFNQEKGDEDALIVSVGPDSTPKILRPKSKPPAETT